MGFCKESLEERSEPGDITGLEQQSGDPGLNQSPATGDVGADGRHASRHCFQKAAWSALERGRQHEGIESFQQGDAVRTIAQETDPAAFAQLRRKVLQLRAL